MAADKDDSIYINSLIGEKTLFKGDIKIHGLLRIDGDFIGNISETGKVLIGKTGRALCNINTVSIVVGGVVKGNISASDKIILLSSGMVFGNIRAPKLVIEEGFVLQGEIESGTLLNKAAANG